MGGSTRINNPQVFIIGCISLNSFKSQTGIVGDGGNNDLRGVVVRVFTGLFRVVGYGSFSSNISFLSLFKLMFACETVFGGVADFATMSASRGGLGAVIPFGFALFLGGRFWLGS